VREMVTRAKRTHVGETTQMRIKLWFESYDFDISLSGQEYWLNQSTHEIIRRIHDDPTISFVRFFPDMTAYHKDYDLFLIESKGTTEKNFDNNVFFIETACFENAQKLMANDIRVLLVFETENFEFLAQWANQIIEDDIKKRFSLEESKTLGGSKTPATLIWRSAFCKLDDIFPCMRKLAYYQ